MPVTLRPDLPVPTVMDLARLTRLAYAGGDLSALLRAEQTALAQGGNSAVHAMNLDLLHQLTGQKDAAQQCQDRALQAQRLYRVESLVVPRLRMLAFVAPGDLQTNLPFEFLLENQPVETIKLYLMPGEKIPDHVPDHDVALVAIGEGDDTLPILRQLQTALAHWPRPVLNDPARLADMGRETLFARLRDCDSIVIPVTARADRAQLQAMAANPASLAHILPKADFPIIIRPTDSHAGRGLERLDSIAALPAYLADWPDPEFFVSPFINYAGADGHFRKARLVFVDRTPHLCHLAIGDHWMVHYLNAGMMENAAKRQEEATAMQGFAEGFAQRQARAIAALADRVGLDYFIIDCAELPDGRMMVFEGGIAMIVHALDDEAMFPYKQPIMRALFNDFYAMLKRAAQNGRPT